MIAAALIAGTAALAARAARRPGARAGAGRARAHRRGARRRAQRRRADLARAAAARCGGCAGRRAGLATALRRCAARRRRDRAALRSRSRSRASLLPPTSVAAHRRRRARQPRRPAGPAAGGRDLAGRRLSLSTPTPSRSPGADRGRRRRGDRRASSGPAAGGELGPLLYVPGALIACAVLVIAGSPWVGGKALATASPAIPFAAMLGAGWLAAARLARGRRRRRSRWWSSGVVWSNALGYGGASLAPPTAARRARADRRAGRGVQGPTLMTEYSPYGARHFLRDSDPEGISELRRHSIPLRDGSEVAEGRLRRHRPRSTRWRSGSTGRSSFAARRRRAGRPPVPTGLERRVLRGLAASGRRQRRWRRGCRSAASSIRSVAPSAIACSSSRSAATCSPPPGEPPLVIGLDRARYPRSWATAGTRDAPVPAEPGTLVAEVDVGRAGEYELWLGGSLRPGATLRSTAGRSATSATRSTTRAATSASARSSSPAGAHTLELIVGGPDAASRERRRCRTGRPAGRSADRGRRRELARSRPPRRAASAGAAGTGSRSAAELRARRLRAALAVGRRPGPGRLVGGRARAAGDLSRARRLGHRGHLGAGRLQPRAGDLGAAGGVAARAASGPPRVALAGIALFGVASLVCGARRLDRAAARGALRSGGRRRRGGLRLARAAAVGGRRPSAARPRSGRARERSAPRSAPASAAC